MDPVVHFEIPVDDVERAIEFYKKNFGWAFNKFDSNNGPYWIIATTEVDDKMMPVKPGSINGGMMKRQSQDHVLTNYITVSSIDDALKKIETSGGTVCMPKSPIGSDMGWIAMFKDTEGNLMGLHQMGDER